MSIISRFRRTRRGATAVEFAIVCPLIVASVLGTFETGRALYVRNHVSEACATGARAVAVTPTMTNDQIRTAVLAEFPTSQQPSATVTVVNQTISGRAFKRIRVVYAHEYIVKFGRALSGVTFTIDRYVPG